MRFSKEADKVLAAIKMAIVYSPRKRLILHASLSGYVTPTPTKYYNNNLPLITIQFI